MLSLNKIERRAFPREKSEQCCSLILNSKTKKLARLIDYSSNGALIETDATCDLSLNDKKIKLVFGNVSFNSDVDFTVSRFDQSEMAIKFKSEKSLAFRQRLARASNDANSNKTFSQNVSCTFNMGEIIALVGTSGGGKSTFLRMVAVTILLLVQTAVSPILYADSQHDYDDHHDDDLGEIHLAIKSPQQARKQGLESLRLAVSEDGSVPLPDQLDEFVRDRNAAIQLGKALFWDMQVGSDSVQACASCHFHAGADNRATNQINPNLLTFIDQRNGDVEGYYQAPKNSDTTFHTKEPNHRLTRNDFPFVKSIQDFVILDNGDIGPASGNSNDIASSMGILLSQFNGVQAGVALEMSVPVLDTVWNIDGETSVRRVEPRNTPSVINAVFNFSNFWDGRANPNFNGQSAFGDEDPFSFIVINEPQTGLAIRQISLNNASLASQAVAPLTSISEMSFGNPPQNNPRSLFEIGYKLLRRSPANDQPLAPLGLQHVHPTDSVLGELANKPQHTSYRHRGVNTRYRGLNTTYQAMIKKAFADVYWSSPVLIPGPNNLTFSQMEANFGLFFGLSVMLYQATLVSDQSSFDRWMETGRFNKGFANKELAGLNLFIGQGQCIQCHSGPEFTNASVRKNDSGTQAIRAMDMAEGSAFYDNGFYNISVTLTTDDIGRGGNNPFGQPLAYSRQALFDRLGINTIPFPIFGDTNLPASNEDTGEAVCGDVNHNDICDLDESIHPESQRVAVDGAFKTPGLRNSELTGPYFHNGGMATLRQVVQFYNRGGNFCRFNIKDLDPAIQPLGLSRKQEKQLVAFLVSLTDRRVKYRQAPFDHPELRLPKNGLEGRKLRTIKAVGARGARRALKTFLRLKPAHAGFTPEGTCLKD